MALVTPFEVSNTPRRYLGGSETKAAKESDSQRYGKVREEHNEDDEPEEHLEPSHCARMLDIEVLPKTKECKWSAKTEH